MADDDATIPPGPSGGGGNAAPKIRRRRRTADAAAAAPSFTDRLLATRAAAVGFGSARDILLAPPLALSERLDLDAAAVEALVGAAAAAVAAGMGRQTLLALLQASRAAPPPIPTGLPALDAALRGGLPRAALTELVGPAGVGKTQLCLGAVAAALAGDPAASAVYVDAEGSFSGARLAGMLGARGALDAVGIEAALGQRVAVVAPAGAADAAARLAGLAAARPPGLALVVLDSVAALVDHAQQGAIARAAAVAEVAAAAKALADATGCAVLAVNQVIAPRAGGGDAAGGGTGVAVVAALGPGWAHAVSTRLCVEARPWPGGVGLGAAGASAAGGLRWVWIAKSPSAPAAAAPFIIGPAGPGPPPADVEAAALASGGGGPPPRPPWARSGEAVDGGGGEGGVLGAALWGDVGLPDDEEGEEG